MGKSIFPITLGPSNFLVAIFSILPCTFSGVIEWSTGARVSNIDFAVGSSFLTGFFTNGSSIFFVDFLGRVEESIKDKSILSIILGDSTSGASIFMVAGFSTSFSTTLTSSTFSTAKEALTSCSFTSSFTSSLAGFAVSTSMATIFLALSLSATAFLGSSTWSALSLATLSL